MPPRLDTDVGLSSKQRQVWVGLVDCPHDLGVRHAWGLVPFHVRAVSPISHALN